MIIFLVALFCVSLIAYETYKCGISPMPTNKKARKLIISTLSKAQPQSILDLGSGWGHLILSFAKHFPLSSITGYETSLIPYAISILLKKMLKRENLLIRREDFLKKNLLYSEALVCYLYPKAMETLSKQIKKKAIKGNLLISHAFALPGFIPQKTLSYGKFFPTKIYIYQI